MAGMLPGVECARRRRLHQGGASEISSWTRRRSSFCLYAGGRETHLAGGSPAPRIAFNGGFQSEGLGDAATEARERLDERLRTIQRTSSETRSCSESSGPGMMGSGVLAGLRRAVISSRKRAKCFRRRPPAEQDDCAVCLEAFQNGDDLLQLPCAHRFHCCCVSPWLENSSHCPCCRMDITSERLLS